jgi:ABC-type nitrate/sulfonate/bicarbonate transport system permease component
MWEDKQSFFVIAIKVSALWITIIVTELILGRKGLGEEFNYDYSKLKRKEKKEKAMLATLQ